MPNTKIIRNNYIDILRALGLLLLIIAHTNPPLWLKELRTFDVPLMVFISAICYKTTNSKILPYCIKRFKRIYIPVVVFLIIFFPLLYFLDSYTGNKNFGIPSIIGSFLLLNGPSIGYVWIMRVFLMMAFIIPLINPIIKKTNFAQTIFIVATIIFLQEYLVVLIECISIKPLRFILDQYILYAIGYSAIVVIGLKIKEFTTIQKITISSIAFITLIAYSSISGFDIFPSLYKYPPRSIYILYGIGISSLLWSFNPLFSEFRQIEAFKYISANSMWLYLWHIIPVYLINYGIVPIPFWAGRYLFVLIAAICLNILYQHLINLLPEKLYSLIK